MTDLSPDYYAAPKAHLQCDAPPAPAGARVGAIASAVGLLVILACLAYVLTREGFGRGLGGTPLASAALLVLGAGAGAPYMIGWFAAGASSRTLRLSSALVNVLYGLGYAWLLAGAVSESKHFGVAFGVVLATACFINAWVAVRDSRQVVPP